MPCVTVSNEGWYLVCERLCSAENLEEFGWAKVDLQQFLKIKGRRS
jgi:hypothetical protein